MPRSNHRFPVRELKDPFTTLSAGVRAEIERRIPEVSTSLGVPIHELRTMIAGMVRRIVEEDGTEYLTPEEEAEFLIHTSLQALQQFTGLDV